MPRCCKMRSIRRVAKCSHAVGRVAVLQQRRCESIEGWDRGPATMCCDGGLKPRALGRDEREQRKERAPRGCSAWQPDGGEWLP